MKDNKPNWLPHLNEIVPELGKVESATMYAIALEGWRRGLTLSFFRTFTKRKKMIIQYSLAYQGRKHKFQLSFGDQVSKEASNIAKDKDLAKKYLFNSKVQIPIGKRFNEESDDTEIINESKKIGFPLVVKPTYGSLGKGVVVNISNESELIDALKYVREDLHNTDLIVEQFINGEEFRVYVIDNEVVGVYKRIPANVIGDGTRSIKDLISIKNKIRKGNPHLSKYPININSSLEELLSSSGLTLESVPKDGERIFLGVKNDLPLGGDSIDATEQFSDKDKNIAVKAAKALPGMSHCGIDIIIDRNSNSSYVLEINPRPNIGGHLFPMEGQARDVPKAIIDYYFPETISDNLKGKNHHFYFNFKSIAESIRKGIIEEATVPSIPKGNLVRNKITVTGSVVGVGYRNWVRRKAINMGINGHVKNLKNGNVIIVAAGKRKNVKIFIETLNEQSPKNANVKEVRVRNWGKSVTVGFNVKKV